MQASMQRLEDQSPRRSGLRYWALAAVALILISLVGFVVARAYPLIRHRRVTERMEIAILKLAVNRPPELTDDQWAYCIAWTWNLNANYGTHPSYVPTDDLERVARGLEQRIDHGPRLATIDWVWDQYIKACPRARSYEQFRPTAPENKAAFEAGEHGGNSLSWFRSNYEQRVAQRAGAGG